MRRVFLMALAIAVLGGVGATGAVASSKSPGCENRGYGNNNDKPGCRDDKRCDNRGHGNSNYKPGCRDDKRCDNRGHGNSNDKPGCRDDKRCDNRGHGNNKHRCEKPKKCEDGYVRDGKHCKPRPRPEEPKPCPDGKSMPDKYGKCPKPEEPKPCPDGKSMPDKYGKCPEQPKPCPDGKTMPDEYGNCPKPPPNNCEKADLILLKAITGPTGPLPRLVCLYFGDNAPNADKAKDCPDADIALPIDSLIGACVFLSNPTETPAAGTAAPSVSSGGTAGLQGVTSTVGGTAGLQSVVSTATSTLAGAVG